MGGHNNIPLQSAWLSGSMRYAPGDLYGTEFFVDSVNGNDGNDGLSWSTAVATIEQAISLNNTYIALASNINKRNRIYLGGGTFSETLTTLPNQCDIIGVGNRTAWKVLINGVLTCGTAVNSCHFYDIGFYSNTSAPLVTIPSGSHGIEFHGCEFINGGSGVTRGLYMTNCSSVVVDNNMFVGNPVLPIGIFFAGPLFNGCKITNNFISATTGGIVGHTNVTADYQTLIAWNVIGRWDPNSGQTQLTEGIALNTDSAFNCAIVGNWISAVDAIDLTGCGANKDAFMCIGNRVGEAATAAWEDA